MKRRIPPSLALFIVAPAFGELFSGSAPLNEYINPFTFLTLSLLYGCGAIIARELVVRWNKGGLSLLLLGFAYGIYEEGLMVQSFFDPTWMDLGSLAVYGRVGGVNWVWAEHLTIYHAAISILASVTFVEIFYPERRNEPWVTSRGWWIANWAGFIGIYAIWEVNTSYNAGGWKLVAWIVVLLLVLAARLAPAGRAPADVRHPPPAWQFWLAGFLGVLGHFYLVYAGADEGLYPFQTAMILVAGYDLLVLWLVRRWSRAGVGWDDRQRINLVNGALMLFLVLGPLTTGGQYPVMYFSNPVFLLLLWWAARRVKSRYDQADHLR